MTGIKRTIAAAAVLLAAGTAGGATGYALRSPSASPAPCHVASSWLPSGDAIDVDVHGSAWTAGSKVAGPLRQFVCTDGSWVAVSHYGN
jgi:hypothetical protein